MTHRSLAHWLTMSLLLAFSIHMAVVYDELPERMASHFDAHGVANGYQDKSSFALLVATLELVLRANLGEGDLESRSLWVAVAGVRGLLQHLDAQHRARFSRAGLRFSQCLSSQQRLGRETALPAP